MTDREWDSFSQLYRQIWKAHAELATLRTMLTTAEIAALQDRPDIAAKAIAVWKARLEKSRGAVFYERYLSKGEAHIAQAEPQRSDTLLMKLFSEDPPPGFPPRQLT